MPALRRVVSAALLPVLAIALTSFVLIALNLCLVFWAGGVNPGELLQSVLGLAISATLATCELVFTQKPGRYQLALSRWALPLKTVSVLTTATCLVMWAGSLPMSSRNGIVSESDSPDGRWRAVRFVTTLRCYLPWTCSPVGSVSILTAIEPLQNESCQCIWHRRLGGRNFGLGVEVG